MINRVLQRPSILLISRVILGGLFIYASIDKIIQPLAFAQVIHYYRLTPPDLINFLAVIFPWMELVAGLILIIGYRVRGSSLLISILLVFFAIVLTVTAIRGINIACGCFSTSTAVKSNLILRIIEDIGMLLLGLHILLFYKGKSRAIAKPESA
jgi:uncharacterized membrane protein YphA (DoxX/SURF4 family)